MTVVQNPLTTINQPTSARWFGVYPAVVTDNQDPDGQGRVRVTLPWSPDSTDRYDAWARLATMMAGNARGTWFIPDVDDEVLVSFGGGNPDQPYVVGALWNGVDAAPESIDGDNNIKAIVSRQDIRIVLDDTAGDETLTLSTPGGRTITLADGGTSIKIEDPLGNSMEMSPSGINITTSAKLTINASTIDISAAMATVNSAMWTYSGVIKCDSVITPAVVGGSYTPGAGNIW